MQTPRALTAFLLAPLGIAILATAAAAAPIEVAFEPPEVDQARVCRARPPYHVLEDRWSRWDGQDLGGRPVALVRRDLRLLRQQDPDRWAPTIAKADDLLLKTVDSYGGTDRLLDRIDLALAQEKYFELRRDGGLLDRLLEQAGGASASAKARAAALLMSPEVGRQDRGRAIELLKAAAFEGHAGSLIKLAALSAEGVEIPDWDIAPDVAVTMGFGARLGRVDETICDRINQIAGEYIDGDVVQRNVPLAERWYRLSARLGGFHAAWRLARLHMDATEVTRDPELLLASLRQAAEADLPYAMVELAEAYERGALVDRDLDRAIALYDEARHYGSDTALTRLARLERSHAPGSDRFAALLQQVAELPDPPAWVFLELGDRAIATRGRWAGAETARKAYARALEIEPESSAARLRLARMAMRDAETPEAFAKVTSDLRRVVRQNGKTAPMQALQRAYLCRGPNAPQPDLAQYWVEMEAFSGDLTVSLDGPELRRQAEDPDPPVEAQVQAQAINARGRSLAKFLYIRGADSPEAYPALSRFTKSERNQIHTVQAQADLALGKVEAAMAQLEAGIAADEPSARRRLIKLLLAGRVTDEVRARVRRLATPMAETGNGRAIGFLLQADPALDRAEAWRRYGPAIARNGDFRGLAFAIPRLDSDAEALEYEDRARSVMTCSTDNALRLARAMHARGLDDRARHWMTIASGLADRSDWELVALGDAILDLRLKGNSFERAARAYRGAVKLDYPLAMRRLLTMREDNEIDFPAGEAADLFVHMIKSSKTENIPASLNLLSFADDEVRRSVEPRIDRRALYEEAAAEGDPAGQVELARILRDAAEAPGDLDRYAELLKKSAAQGNAEAMMMLSSAYSYGLGVTKSPDASEDWLLRAAEAGNREAIAMARMLQTSRRETQ